MGRYCSYLVPKEDERHSQNTSQLEVFTDEMCHPVVHKYVTHQYSIKLLNFHHESDLWLHLRRHRVGLLLLGVHVASRVGVLDGLADGEGGAHAHMTSIWGDFDINPLYNKPYKVFLL